jgi:hypothetical protein
VAVRARVPSRTRGALRQTGRRARTTRLARLGTRAGGSYALHRARRVFASAERRDDLDAAHELRTAAQVAEVLGDMKGALMKVGQMASYLDAGVPEPLPTSFRAAVEQAAFLRAGAPVSDDFAMEYFGHFYEFVLADDVATIGSDYATKTVRRYFDANGPYRDVLRATNLPPSFVIIQRINLGLYAILARLHATANWRRIAEEIWPFVDGPPSTELARREEAWWSRRRAEAS